MLFSRRMADKERVARHRIKVEGEARRKKRTGRGSEERKWVCVQVLVFSGSQPLLKKQGIVGKRESSFHFFPFLFFYDCLQINSLLLFVVFCLVLFPSCNSQDA